MRCEDAHPQIAARLDGALAGAAATALEAHLQDCAACRAAEERQRAMKAVIRQHAHYHVAPARLARSIRAGLRTLEAPAPPPPWRAAWGWFASGAALASALTLAVSLTLLQPAPVDGLAQELVAAHVRSLMASHLTDVPSSDRHTVKPWFNGRVDLAPPVPDLAGDGFALIGGRLDYLDRRPVAALVYRHRQHPINLFVWPAEAGPAPGAAAALARQGYNLLHWTDGRLVFWAVSDLNAADLESFRALFQRAAAAG